MSRVGKVEINIPDSVTVSQKDSTLSIKGKLGSADYVVPEGLSVAISDKTLEVRRETQTKEARQIHGLTRTLIQNMITGLERGYEKKLNITGIGYKAQVKGKILEMNVGYSHTIEYEIPQGIKIETPKPTEITVKGVDKKLVGDIASRIKHFCEPEPYKGKGITYEGEKIRRKTGKAVG